MTVFTREVIVHNLRKIDTQDLLIIKRELNRELFIRGVKDSKNE